MSHQDLMDALAGGVCIGIEEDSIEEMLHALTQRYEVVLRRRYVERRTLGEVGEELGVVKERVRQLESKALAQLRFLLTKEYEKAYTSVVFTKKQSKEPEDTHVVELSTEDEAYVTGFCEGDGSVGMTGAEHPFIVFIQKEPDVLEYIETLIPGGAWHFSKQSAMWSLSYSRAGLRSLLLDVFVRHVVSERFSERLCSMFSDGRDVVRHAPTISWLAGFFDAEGSAIWKQPACGLQISQKGRDVLDAIQRSFEGHVGPMGKRFQWHAGKRNSNLTGLANKLLKHSHKFRKREDLTSLLTRLYVEKHRMT